ncbi:MAG: hypothetical protein R2838_23575 [Caldilineaceae bacterium]
MAVLLLLAPAGPAQSAAIEQWMPQQRVPGYGDDTLPPVLLADRSRTVHAFTDQVVEDEPSQHAVVYSRWTLDDGWTEPVDVVLSPLKNYAQVLGVQMDDEGWIHLLFYGGSDERQCLLAPKRPRHGSQRRAGLVAACARRRVRGLARDRRWGWTTPGRCTRSSPAFRTAAASQQQLDRPRRDLVRPDAVLPDLQRHPLSVG